MEKKVYELTISEALEKVMPPLQPIELEKLTQKLLDEGCRDDLVVWHGVIVDGHNRYRICHENNIPFSYVERDFDDEAAAKRWIIDNQLGRRNLSEFVKCELVLPLEASLKAEAKKRQGQRNDLKNIPQNSAGSTKGRETREVLADMAGVSRDTLGKAKRIIAEADEETKERLRRGEVSIYAVSEALKEKARHPEPKLKEESEEQGFNDPGLLSDDSQPLPNSIPWREDESDPMPRRVDPSPGYGLVKDLSHMDETPYFRPPDSVYDIPPIEVYGNMPAGDKGLRGNAEFVHAKSDLAAATEFYVRRAGEILRGMSKASINDENMAVLSEIVANGFNQINGIIKNMKCGGTDNE